MPQPVDLQNAARAELGTPRTWAIHPDALKRIAAVARYGAGHLPVPPDQAAFTEAAARRAALTVKGSLAIVPLKGIITPQGSLLSMLFGGGSGGLQGFRAAFREALGNDDVSAILLDVDSPGGLVDGVPEAAAEIRAARGEKPIVAIADTMAASAAYWIAAQADEIAVTPSGEVGSIGVFRAHEDWSGFDEQLGVKTTLVSAGRFKTEGNPYEPLSDEGRAAWQQDVDDLFALFVDDVAQGRGTTAQAVRDGYGEGRVLPAARAVTAGLADAVETLEQLGSRVANARVTRAKAQNELPPHGEERPGSAQELPADVVARLAEIDELRPPITL